MKNIYKIFIKYVSLNILSMIGMSCYILADTYFISSGVGNIGITALNLVLPVYSLLSAIGLLLGMGGSTLFSIYKAQGKNNDANTIFTNTIIIGAIVAIIFTIISIFFVPIIVNILQASKNVEGLSIEYLKTILAFSVFFIFNQIFICFVRNDQQPKLTMIAMLVGSFSNILLDYIFIFPLGLGMFGAAFATGLSPVISLCILSIHYLKKQYHFHFNKFIFNLSVIKKILSIGFPSFITELSSGIIMLIFNFIILDISGDVGVAAYGIIANLALVIVSIFTGISQGIQPIISENYGKRNMNNISIITKISLLLAIAIGTLFFIIGLLFSNNLVTIFNKENNQLLSTLANTGIKLYFLAFIIMGLNIVVTSIYSAISKTKQSFLISILRGFVIIIPTIFILSYMFKMNGVWITVFVSEFLTLTVSIFIFYKEKKRML